MAPTAGTIDTLAAYLTSGYYRGEGGTGRDWNTGGDTVVTVNLVGLTDEGEALARAALEAWEMVADIRFQETTGGADITFDDASTGARTSTSYYPSNGTLITAHVNIGTSWLTQYGTTVGSYSFQTYLHEIGHALGLGHGGSYDGGASYDHATWTNDSWQQSVMSYLDQDENPNVRAGKAYVVTPMLTDIFAIQALYGAPESGATNGNTTWGRGSNLSNYLDVFFGPTHGDLGRNALSIYDRGGIDTLNLSDGASRQVIDLAPGAFSSSHGQLDNIAIARNTTIENAFGGSGWDSIAGNSAANVLRGNAGGDAVSGEEGDDSLFGGDGSDRLYGGSDADRLWGDGSADRLDGGSGADALFGGGGGDVLLGLDGADVAKGGDGDDVIEGGDGDDRLGGGIGDDALEGGDGQDSLFGLQDDDQLTGGAGNDSLNGGTGSDRLAGGAGNDQLSGGAGEDRFVFHGGRDVIVDFTDDVDTILLDDAFQGNGADGLDRVLDRAIVTGGGVLLDFGNGNTLRIENLSVVEDLRDDLRFI